MTQRIDTLTRPIIIADDELMATALQKFLGDSGPFIKIDSGKALLSLLEDEALFPVLLLLDMQMPI